MRARYTTLTVLSLVAGALNLCGCGSGAEGDAQVDVYPVSGKITFSGGPVPNAIVSFAPKDGQPVATARTDNKGQYVLSTYDLEDGAAAGNFVVLVTKSSPSKAASATGAAHGAAYNTSKSHGSKAAASTGIALPDKYGSADKSDLTVKVPADDPNAYNFDLKP